MRSIFLILAILMQVVLGTSPATAAEAPSEIKGLWLVTDYPALTVRAGETSTVGIRLQNYNLPPERVTLSVDGVPEDWKVALLGGGQPIGAVMPATNETVSFQLRIDVPAETASGPHKLVLRAKGQSASAELPLDISLGNDLPAKLSLKPKLPALRGTSRSNFDYELDIRNESGKDLLVQLAAVAPPNFQTSFTENYGSQEVTSVPIAAGQTKTMKLKVDPPDNIAADEYRVVASVAAEDARAEVPLTIQITGRPELRIAGKDGRLSGEAEAGEKSTFTLVVSNEGTAPIRDVEISGTPPGQWEVSFEPKKIDLLGPGEKAEVQAALTPSAKAIAGDYMTTFRASGEGASSSADFRITVRTSTLWGVVGLGLIAVALLVVVGAVARYGRR